jgi:hypothetical protein
MVGTDIVAVTAPVAKLEVRQLSSARSVVRTEQTRRWYVVCGVR